MEDQTTRPSDVEDRDARMLAREALRQMPLGYESTWTDHPHSGFAMIFWDATWGVHTWLGPDYEYHENLPRIQGHRIGILTVDELRTWFTWLAQGERWCTGLIRSHINNGNLRALLTRILELDEQNALPEPPRPPWVS